MNILLSYKWLKEYVDVKQKPRELAKLLSLHSMSVEKVMPEVALLSDKIVLAEILEIKPHPNADRLQIAKVSDGKETHQVVCGAPNIKVGMRVAFAKLGAAVKWHGEGDPVELEKASIRGEMSFGMIADDSEIGLAMELNKDGVTDYSHVKCALGTPMAEALKLDDTIFDIEITTNRIDAGSVTGMAREVAAVTGAALKQKKANKIVFPKKAAQKLEVAIKDVENCKGFIGVVLDGITVESSPEWLQRRLQSAGIHPVNNIVDVTNYVMHEYGHPLHAFDYRAVDGGQVIVRSAKKDEQLETLDGKVETLDASMVVVADSKKALSLGGVMGGESSKVKDDTTTILLEAATWNPTTIRRTAMKLDKFSDASSYFSKGVSPELAEAALLRAMELLLEITNARIASPLVKKGYKTYKPKSVKMSLPKAEQYIGAKLKLADVKRQLTALGFGVKAAKNVMTCTVPHWRQYDVAIEEDLIEEVARLYGYQNIQGQLPAGELPLPVFDKQIEWETKLRHLMKGAGYTEAYTYSMVSERLHEIGGRQLQEAIRLLNPLDDEHAVMRTALLPSLIEVAAANQGIKESVFLFEIANIYESQGAEKLPKEIPMMAALVMTGNAEHDFRFAKGTADRIMRELGLEDEVRFEKNSNYVLVNRASSIDYLLGDRWMGTVGLIAPATARALGLKRKAAVCILPLAELIEVGRKVLSYEGIPKFPSIDLDLSVVVAEATPWADVERIARQAGGELLKSVELFDIYHQKEGKKSFAFHLTYRDDNKTLEMHEVDPLQKAIIDLLASELDAELKG